MAGRTVGQTRCAAVQFPSVATKFSDEGELRAASAEILGRYVGDGADIPIQNVAGQLAARYGVPVHTR